MMKEEWKAVPGCEGYSASSLGRIKGPRCILKPSPMKNGYLGVKIKGKGTTVHAAVCSAFHGQRPTAAHTVNHKNGVKTDNAPKNLEWLTQAENNRHASDVLGRQCGRPAKAREPIIDTRHCIDLDLTSHGGPRLRIEPRVGYVSCRLIDLNTGTVECAALKTLLHGLADRLPRRLGLRACT
jgi:hypothetical protein